MIENAYARPQARSLVRTGAMQSWASRGKRSTNLKMKKLGIVPYLFKTSWPGN